MIGAISGDIIGSSYEFNPVKTKHFELYPRSSKFTDDTVLTLAVAKWLCTDEDTNEESLVKIVKEICVKYPDSGYGRRFEQWLSTSNTQPYNSWGNGSAMRVSPVGWAKDTLSQTEELAEISAKITHNHIEGIKGAKATAGAVYLARTGSDKDLIKKYVEDNYGYDLERKLVDIRPEYKFNESCQETVPEAVICFLESNSYEDTIRNAISLGGDADTLAAIAGAIAAAYYEVPDQITDMALSKLDENLKNIYNEFVGKYEEKKYE
ncbi:MAG: hypothetical protein BZ136_00150 [Methanosphaera sp. rholeuAM74]|nr:MAG: hypothetical protein BZ136_00150 [Methanosphaera sp. rholeuAM74]